RRTRQKQLTARPTEETASVAARVRPMTLDRLLPAPSELGSSRRAACFRDFDRVLQMVLGVADLHLAGVHDRYHEQAVQLVALAHDINVRTLSNKRLFHATLLCQSEQPTLRGLLR